MLSTVEDEFFLKIIAVSWSSIPINLQYSLGFESQILFLTETIFERVALFKNQRKNVTGMYKFIQLTKIVLYHAHWICLFGEIFPVNCYSTPGLAFYSGKLTRKNYH